MTPGVTIGTADESRKRLKKSEKLWTILRRLGYLIKEEQIEEIKTVCQGAYKLTLGTAQDRAIARFFKKDYKHTRRDAVTQLRYWEFWEGESEEVRIGKAVENLNHQINRVSFSSECCIDGESPRERIVATFGKQISFPNFFERHLDAMAAAAVATKEIAGNSLADEKTRSNEKIPMPERWKAGLVLACVEHEPFEFFNPCDGDELIVLNKCRVVLDLASAQSWFDGAKVPNKWWVIPFAQDWGGWIEFVREAIKSLAAIQEAT